MQVDRPQRLRVLEGRYVVEHLGEARGLPPGTPVLALVDGPDGRTVIRRDDDAEDGAWAGLWTGDEPHDPEATGMLAAVVAPLATAEVPVVVASTFHGDVVLVPAGRLDGAVAALRDAGHHVG